MPSKSVYVAAYENEYSLVQSLTFSVSDQLMPVHRVQLAPISSEQFAFIQQQITLARIPYVTNEGIFILTCFDENVMKCNLRELVSRRVIAKDFLERAFAQYPVSRTQEENDELTLPKFLFFRQQAMRKKSINVFQQSIIESSLCYIFDDVLTLQNEDAIFVLNMMLSENISTENNKKLIQLASEESVARIRDIFNNPNPQLSSLDNGFFNLEGANDAETAVTGQAVHAAIRDLIEHRLALLVPPKITANI